MLYVHAPGSNATYPTDKAALKGGSSYELFVYRAPRFVAAGIGLAFLLASVAFLVYALFSKIDDLWIYATAATGATSFLTCLAIFLAHVFNYERISLASGFANAYACQHALLVIRGAGGRAEGWFASGFVLFIRDRDAHLYAAADFSRFDPRAADAGAERGARRMASALQRRSYVQTDSTDLRDYLRTAAVRNRLHLARKAGLVTSRG